MVKSILFVCLGNICRSPLAEGIARKALNFFKLKLGNSRILRIKIKGDKNATKRCKNIE